MITRGHRAALGRVLAVSLVVLAWSPLLCGCTGGGERPRSVSLVPSERVVNGRIFGVHEPRLTFFYPPPGAPDREAAVLVLPGGGYEYVSVVNEGDPVAQRFAAAGFVAAVLVYRCEPHRHPVPLLDAAAAVRYVRRQADDLGVRADRVAMVGFSAGGHLAATLATSREHQDARPDALALVYPVVSMKPGVTHAGSRRRLLGPEPSPSETEALSAEQRVDAETPPTFLAHCEDDGVSIQNSVLFHGALLGAGVETEFARYPSGGHGFGLGEGGPAADWPDRCIDFLRRTLPAHP